MRIFSLVLALVCGVSNADTGYVYSGDLNGDGVADSIRSGPSDLFGNGGGPFVVSISDGSGGFIARDIGLHPLAVSLDLVTGHPRLWTYWRSSCCGGTLSVTTLDEKFETYFVPLEFGEDFSSPTASRDVYNSIFSTERRIEFEVVADYEPPPPLRGEWGK